MGCPSNKSKFLWINLFIVDTSERSDTFQLLLNTQLGEFSNLQSCGTLRSPLQGHKGLKVVVGCGVEAHNYSNTNSMETIRSFKSSW